MNQYVQCDGYTQVLINSETHGQFVIKVDNEDVTSLKNHVWGINKCWNKNTNKHPRFYAGCNMGRGSSLLMHRFIMNAGKGVVVDHINGDEQDNRKENLRICSQRENCENSKERINNISGQKGVCWDSTHKNWIAYIKIKKCNRRLGYYNDINKATRARRLAEIRYFSEYAYKSVEDIEYDLYFKGGYKVKKPSCNCLERYANKIPDWTLATIIEDDINIPVKYDPNKNGIGYLRYLDYTLNFCPECGKPMINIE